MVNKLTNQDYINMMLAGLKKSGEYVTYTTKYMLSGTCIRKSFALDFGDEERLVKLAGDFLDELEVTGFVKNRSGLYQVVKSLKGMEATVLKSGEVCIYRKLNEEEEEKE